MAFVSKVYTSLSRIFSRRHFYKSSKSFSLWILLFITLMSLAAQCNTPTPALPPTPNKPPIRVALLTPTGGELATFGRIIRNGIIMAFDEWNAQDGVANYRFEWVNYNTDCTIETAQQATQQAIDDGLKFIIGPICSEAAIAAAAKAESAGVLMIAPAATHPLVTINHKGVTRPTVFGVSYSYQWQGQAAARFAHNVLSVHKAAILFNSGDSYTTALADAFAQAFEAANGQIVYQTTYSPGSTDFTKILQTIGQTEAQLIYLPANAAVANQVVGRLNELGLSALSSENGLVLLGSDAWESEGLNLTVTAGSYFPSHFSSEDERGQPWVQAYKSIYAITPDTLAALGYDAANILAAGLEQAGSLKPEAVAKALEQGRFQGVTGPISFDSGHNPLKPIPFLVVEDNDTQYIISIIP